MRSGDRIKGRNEVMMDKRNYGIALLVAFVCLTWSAVAFADFSGKVVGVQDGDTLEVMKERVAVRVRLHGIDCPEKGQAFGQRAKQFASELAFGKTVRVIEKGRGVAWFLVFGVGWYGTWDPDLPVRLGRLVPDPSMPRDRRRPPSTIGTDTRE
jgi:hypothetical protein